MTPAHAEVAGQIERAYRGYHVWTSDEGPLVCNPRPAPRTGHLADGLRRGPRRADRRAVRRGGSCRPCAPGRDGRL